MPGFKQCEKFYPNAAPIISQLVMQKGLTEASSVGQIFNTLKEWIKTHDYNENAADLNVAITQKIWSCVSLTKLLVVTYCMLRDKDVMAPGNVKEQQVLTRRLSMPGINAALDNLRPNVSRPDKPGESRYTFSNHTYVVIEYIAYDMLMGRTGEDVEKTFPIGIARNNVGAETCQLIAPPHPVAAMRHPVAVPGASEAAPAGLATYHLRASGGRIGSLPGFQLVIV